MLLAVRDLQPVTTGELSRALGRSSQTLTQSLQIAERDGLVARTYRGWVPTAAILTGLAHVPSRAWDATGGKRGGWGSLQHACLEALGERQLTSSQVAAAVGAERTNVHKALARAARAGLVASDGGRPVRWRRA